MATTTPPKPTPRTAGFETADLQLRQLLADYATGKRDPAQVLRAAVAASQRFAHKNVWIERFDESTVLAQLDAATARRDAGQALPLYGVPFAVKDNIDVAGQPTTAACPHFSHVAAESAECVRRLIDAGAILLGKANLDQFATGLVGTRSPYGACSSAFDDGYISGGSSSGSALAVALGMVSFALGTDTAGSGRVPAGLNNIVGLKPTRGWVSTRGVVPACRSLDCVSVFAGSVGDARRVLQVIAGFDAHDPFSRETAVRASDAPDRDLSTFRFGVPRAEQLEFYGDEESKTLYEQALARLEALGGRAVEVDLLPFQRAAELLYAGPWVAERTAAVGIYVRGKRPGTDPSVQQIIEGGRRFSATDVYEAQWKLNDLRKQAAPTWEHIDILALPTVPTTYRLEQIAADPLGLNSRLGYYTNFVNLLDLCGVAVPAGFSATGLPFGMTLLAPAFADALACSLAERLHAALPSKVGATQNSVAASDAPSAPTDTATARRLQQDYDKTPPVAPAGVQLAVVGAHLRGQPLHHQLEALAAKFVAADHTASSYRLYALGDTSPAKPGLARVTRDGSSIEVEIYELSYEAFGRITEQVPPPLCIGNVELADGRWVKSFLCEGLALESAQDITLFGGWRAFIASPT